MSRAGYRNYKPSGAGWFSEVPSHWNVERLKWSVASCRNGIWGDEATGGEEDIACARVADFDRTRLAVKFTEPTMRAVTAKDRAGRQLIRGNLLLEKSGGGEGQPVGAVVLYDDDRPAVCSNFVARMELAEGMVPSFWRYVHAAAYKVRLTTRSINQTSGIQNLDQSRYLNELAPFPPAPEQTAIASFLDRETGKIDALVEEQRRLIELLKEKRQAVISHAVTKGLDPSAKMKPSAVAWLGDVPEHWEVRTVGAACSYLSYGFTNPMPTADSGPFMLTALDVQDGFINFDSARQTSQEAFDALTAKSRPQAGDVLVTKDGTLGRVALYDGPVACINQSVALLRPQAGIHPAFLEFCLRGGTYQSRMIYDAGGTTIKHIYISRLAKMPLAWPALPEQIKITKHLSDVCLQFDRLADEAAKAADLLVERRTALISAAVTGKIDVRETLPAVAAGALNVDRARLLVAAEIVDMLSYKRAFGRVKLQKLLYLAEADAGIEELKGQYQREAAGPLDRRLIAEVDVALQRDQHVSVVQSDGPGSQVVYRLRGERGAYHNELVASIGDRAAALRALIEKLGDLDTKSVEAVTTLYAVWNDALLDRREPTDAMVVSGVLEDWHPEKAQKFKAEDLFTWLGWMRRNKLVPRGTGPRTTTGRLFL